MYAIVFCLTRKETQEVASKLINDGYNADGLIAALNKAGYIEKRVSAEITKEKSNRSKQVEYFRRNTVKTIYRINGKRRPAEIN